MIKVWSELPLARTREQIADVATLIWVVFWGSIVWQLFQFLVGFAGVGRAVHEGGENMIEGGRSLGDSLAGLPLVGSQVRDLASGAFAAGGQPISSLGTELVEFITIVSVVLALLLALVTIVPWLIRYVPWRLERLRRVRSAHRAIRRAPQTDSGIEKTLALRAISRLDYDTLLDFTPDPVGDWVAGRHDRLARAEMASVGLRP
jgi:hypothetical protein